jgi:hypothetical protein
VIAQLPQVKLRLPEPDVNGCFDRRDDFRFSKGDSEHTEQRADHGAIMLWLHSLGEQQARPGAILLHRRAILSFDSSHTKNLLCHDLICNCAWVLDASGKRCLELRHHGTVRRAGLQECTIKHLWKMRDHLKVTLLNKVGQYRNYLV